eukprot:gnl/TRDRNA2_/TRDRNA2_166220_c0_seq1.p1 gnl/TRDRNA2_/TRDRNA2_166220_c0~~gnl/TRDRNA2_/TRDRNA2_166220_c0_seq1.p1  ORF type:complete len:305 (-),score=47.17 gnl/TRDRNA2_/TRDRNA2_166220_c0_seq1:278-1171(-)
MKAVSKDLLDLVHLARDAKVRQQVVCTIAEVVQKALGSGSKEMAAEACWRLCEMSFASSLTDIKAYPSDSATGPVVVVCGYAGSHIDDVTPLAARWSTHYGAAVVVFSPCLVSGMREDQAEYVYDEVMKLLGTTGRPLVLHIFSNGGHGTALQLLTRWRNSVSRKPEAAPPLSSLRCVILDSVGYTGDDGRKYSKKLEQTDKARFDSIKNLEKATCADDQFYDYVLKGCAFATLLKFNAATSISDEPCDSVGRVIERMVESGRAADATKKGIRVQGQGERGDRRGDVRACSTAYDCI